MLGPRRALTIGTVKQVARECHLKFFAGQPMLWTSTRMARILVIDDDADIRALLEQTLTPAGHEVILAADGKEGVEKYREKPSDVVITDLYMPNQEGLETIAELHRRFPDAAIIAMSGRTAGIPLLPVAERLGAVAVLEKPFSPSQLLSAVEKAL
jgi:DNA-binding NtrC family response regulator